jgi:NADPH:quinone reductase-like Zn-dependent oxidoreductase
MSMTGLELKSLVTPSGELRITIEEMAVPNPGPDELLIRVQAAPINPSDLPPLLGSADLGGRPDDGRCGPSPDVAGPGSATRQIAPRRQ